MINLYTALCWVATPYFDVRRFAPHLCDRDRGYDLLQKIKRFDNGVNRHIEAEWDAE